MSGGSGSGVMCGHYTSASSAPGVSQLCLQVAADAGRRDCSRAASGCWFWSCSCWPSMLAVGAGGRDWPCIRTKKEKPGAAGRAFVGSLVGVLWGR